MSYTFVNEASISGVNGGTTSPVNMTGANTFVLVIGTDPGETVSDSQGNTYTQLSYFGRLRFYVAFNATASASMTFTISGTSIVADMHALGFSGGKITNPTDQTNNNTTGSSTSLTTGSITPTENDELLVAAAILDADPGSATVNIDSSFTPSPTYIIAVSGNYLAAAYFIQTSAAAVNPTLSWANSISGDSGIYSFKAEPTGGVTYVLMGEGLT